MMAYRLSRGRHFGVRSCEKRRCEGGKWKPGPRNLGVDHHFIGLPFVFSLLKPGEIPQKSNNGNDGLMAC